MFFASLRASPLIDTPHNTITVISGRRLNGRITRVNADKWIGPLDLPEHEGIAAQKSGRKIPRPAAVNGNQGIAARADLTVNDLPHIISKTGAASLRIM